MKNKLLLNKLKGIHTIESVKDILNINRQKAIYYIHRLRKHGYVKTKRLSNNKRIYDISFENRLKGNSYYDIINIYSPIKIAAPIIYKIYGKKVSLEDALVYAIKSKSLRAILASLSLFKKINKWSKLYALAKKEHMERQIGALYDLSRKIIKTRRMTKRFRNSSMPKKHYKFEYIIPKLKSSDFKDIEKAWKVYLPFNSADLEEYK